MILLAIDPGVDTGWALFNHSALLTRCGLGGPPYSFEDVNHVIIEKPQVYRRALSKGDPNDLITLAIQVGRYVERFDKPYLGTTVELVVPAEWKGQVPKAVHHARILDELTLVEKTGIANALASVATGKRHNTYDAIGLGLWALKSKGLRS